MQEMNSLNDRTSFRRKRQECLTCLVSVVVPIDVIVKSFFSHDSWCKNEKLFKELKKE